MSNVFIKNSLKKKVVQIDYSLYKYVKEYVESNALKGTHGRYMEEKVGMSTKYVMEDGEYLEKKRCHGNSSYYVTEELLDTYHEVSDYDYRQVASSFG